MLLSICLIVLAILAGLAALLGLYVLWSMFLPTRGKRIADYPNPGKALLVLDIQESGNKAPHPFPTGTRLGNMIEAVNRLIECFDNSDREVAYIRQVFSSNFISRLHGGRILAGRMEPRISRWVKVINGNDFAKNRTDAFSNRKMDQYLRDHQVNEVFLVGLDAAFCVYYTALGALNRGYKVTVVTDAVMSGRDMATILNRYRTKGITVMNSQEVATMLNAEVQKEEK
jgi:nicotinamidase-related amidase